MNPSAKASGTGNTFSRLNEWVERLDIEEFFFVNTTGKVGKVKKSDIDLDNLSKACYNAKVIALGNFASEALEMINVAHFKLPHPSPLNRQINDTEYISGQLSKCREYLQYK